MSSKNKKNYGECIFSLLFLLIGIVWAVNGIRLGVWSEITPAPGLFPLVVGGLLTVLSAVNFFSYLKKPEEQQENKRERQVLLFFITYILACSILINILGMLFTLIFSLILWFKVVVGYKWVKTLIMTACIIAGIYAVFVFWLKVPFPQFLEFL